jgi:hypothetical protein
MYRTRWFARKIWYKLVVKAIKEAKLTKIAGMNILVSSRRSMYSFPSEI